MDEENGELTIADARRLREEAWRQAKLERERMQQLLADRYGSLVESAEAIVSLATAAQEVADFVAALPGRTDFLVDAQAFDDNEIRHIDEETKCSDPISASAGVARLGPRIWRALDSEKIGEACALYWQCSTLCTALGPGERALLGPYARQFETRVAEKAHALLYTDDKNTNTFAQALVARALLKGYNDGLNLFFTAREQLVASCKNPRQATRLVKLTIIQTAELFFGTSAHDDTMLIKEAKAMVVNHCAISSQQIQLITYEPEEVIQIATSWIRNATAALRTLAEKSTSTAATAADPAELIRLVQELRAECDDDKEQWQRACDLIFLRSVVVPSSSEQRQALGLKAKTGKQRLLRLEKELFGSQRSDADAALHAHLLRASSTSLNNTQEDEDWCDLWRSVLAPAAVRLVEQRVCKGLDAARTQLAHLLDATENAFDRALTPIELGLEWYKNLAAQENIKEIPQISAEWRRHALVVSGTSDEINWISERIASWLEQRLAALALDAASLAYTLLRSSNNDHEEKIRARDVILEFTKPRFCETLALVATDIRARAAKLAHRCDQYLSREDQHCESYIEQVESTFSRTMNYEMSQSEQARHRFMARTNLPDSDFEQQVKNAKNALSGILILARLAYLTYHTPNCVAIFLTAGESQIFAASTDQDSSLPESFRDARAVVDLSQLRSAFEIADLDGDGLVSPKDCAESVAAVCVGAVAEKARRGPLRFLSGGEEEAYLDEFYTLNLDELALLSVRALDHEIPAHELFAAAFKSALEDCLQHWARIISASVIQRLFTDDLIMYAASWQQDDLPSALRTFVKQKLNYDIDAAFTNPKSILPHDIFQQIEDDDLRQVAMDLQQFFKTSITPKISEKYQRSIRGIRGRDLSRDSAELKTRMNTMRWRDRVIEVELDDGTASAETVQLPCEPVYATLICIWILHEQLEIATCTSDWLITNTRDQTDAPIFSSMVHQDSPLYWTEESSAPHIDFFLEQKLLPPPYVDFEESVHDFARRELLKQAIPLLARAYEEALDAVSDSELVPLALAVDAYFLRFGLRRAAFRERQITALRADRKKDIAIKKDQAVTHDKAVEKRRGIFASVFGSREKKKYEETNAEFLQYLTSTTSRLFRTIKNRIDPIDLELYGPFIKADAQRFYARSEKVFNFLFGGVDPISQLKHSKANTNGNLSYRPDDDLDDRDDPFFSDDDQMPPDDFHERPPFEYYNKSHSFFPIKPISVPSSIEQRYQEAIQLAQTAAALAQEQGENGQDISEEVASK